MENDIFERFRKLVTEEQEKGQTAFLIWSSHEERKNWGNDEKEMMVDNAFSPYGIRSDGKYYGDYRTMELDRAIREYLECGIFLELNGKDSHVAAMLFSFEKLLKNDKHLKFACRGMLYGHLNGPIIAYPSYQKVEFEVKKKK